MTRRYLGSWTLPSGNSCHAYLDLAHGRVDCAWDIPPSSAWSREDIEYWRTISFPEVLRAVATATGQRVLGVTA